MSTVTSPIEGTRQYIRDRLRSEKVKSKTAIVRQLLPEIEVATDAGFTYVQIAGWLEEALRFAISAKHLSVIVSQLHRQKKGRRGKPKAKLDMFERLRVDAAGEASEGFKHDPVADPKKLM